VSQDNGNFRRSSFCSVGQCVEVGRTPDGRIAVRDSATPEKTATFTEADWGEFVKGVKASEFDLDRL
jgi:Domain of unknown function (DUF397)